MLKKAFILAILLPFLGTTSALAYEEYSGLDCAAALEKVGSHTYSVLEIEAYSGLYSDALCEDGAKELDVVVGEEVRVREVNPAPESGWFVVVPFGARAFGDEEDPEIEVYFSGEDAQLVSSTTYFYNDKGGDESGEVNDSAESDLTLSDPEMTNDDELELLLTLQLLSLLYELYDLLLLKAES